VRGSADFSKNNLDCLRFILASIVVLFHSYDVTNIAALSPLGRYCSPHFAVKGFFVISGLLIYRSYTKSSSVSSYLEKRVRRIYPGYVAVIAFAALALSALSTLPLSQYFGVGFWKYLGANLLFLNFLAPSLPGVFTSNYVPVVDGALWTLKIEVAFYLFVPVLHFLCNRFGTKLTMGTFFCLSCAWKYGFAWLAALDSSRLGNSLDDSRNIYSRLDVQFPAQLVYFMAGILLLLYFDTLKHHFLSISCVTALVFVIDRWLLGGALDVFWISGFVFVFGFWRYFGNFAKYGDFSYGIYIVHWPILQTAMALGIGSFNPLFFLFVVLSLTGLAAVLLWNLVESKFLKSSSHYRQVSRSAPS
jgi:peptidoglycan/LPS O-acetylase OafA/YrhL